VINVGSFSTKSFRKTISQAGESVSIPQKVNKLKVKNVGAVDIRIRFNNDGANYWTLKVGDKEDFDIGDSIIMDAAGVGGVGTLELVFS
jgi:hypothetical protein